MPCLICPAMSGTGSCSAWPPTTSRCKVTGRSAEDRTTYRTPGDLIAALGHVDPAVAGELHEWLRAGTGTAGTQAPGLEEIARAAHWQLKALIDQSIPSGAPRTGT